MIKPDGYDDVKANGDYTPVELGGHYAVIKRAEESTSKKGKPMLVVALDFDKADSQPDYFMEAFKKDVRPDKKWPHQAMKYITTEGDDKKCSKHFKTFITCFENSNNCRVNWNCKTSEEFCKQFQGKRIGVVYGIEEEFYDGEVKKKRNIRWFCDYAKAKQADIPKEKLLDNKPEVKTDPDGFINPTNSEAEEYTPFPTL